VYLSKKSDTEGITIFHFKVYYKAIELKKSMVLAQNKYEQWNSKEDPDLNSCSCIHLIFDKGDKNIQWRKDSLFNKCCWETGYLPSQN
jgi:hypothetical protein